MRYLILALADDIDIPGNELDVQYDATRKRLVVRAGDRETHGACWIKCTPGEIVEQQCDALLAQQERRGEAA